MLTACPATRSLSILNTVRTAVTSKAWFKWGKVSVVASAAMMLNTCAPLPSVLDQIKTLGELRVVTRISPLAYYRGIEDEPSGPEYDLARRFADLLGVRLVITPMHSYAEIYGALERGRAHLAAAALKVPSKPVSGILFGPVYHHVQEHLVYRRGGTRPSSLAEIGDGDLEIAAGSSLAKTLHAARDELPDLTWVENSSTDSESLLQGVADGSVDYTIADSTEFAIAHDANPDLRIAFDFPGSESLAWAVSDHYPDFLQSIGGFFAHLNGDGQLASIVRRYYVRSADLQFASAPTFMRHMQSRLALYQKWFEEAAAQSRQDWRLLAAIGYQESKWNPGALSASGAKGLMQLTSDTASAAKVTNPTDARQSIFAGARYLKQIYEKIPTHVPEPDRTWFALAAYNIGYGHIEDARVLAQKAGRDPDSWDDVREFLPLLEQEAWYTQTLNGYARGWEPVRYVDNVRGYRDMLEWAWGGGPRDAALN
jgi:membrane-bound lytic murein transglycosylase F